MTSKNTKYIDSLIEYILDVKPYHTKLREIVEEYHFEDAVNVDINDTNFISAKLASVWSRVEMSDGEVTAFRLPAFFNRPKYFGGEKVFHNSNSLPVFAGIPNLLSTHTAYSYENTDGIKTIYKNKKAQNEGLDYYVSQGAFSFKLSKTGSVYNWIETFYFDSPAMTTTMGGLWKKTGPSSFEVGPSAAQEAWTLIKVHPLAYSRPVFNTSTPGMPVGDDGGPDQYSYENSYVFGYDIANYESGTDHPDCSSVTLLNPADPAGDDDYPNGKLPPDYYAAELYDMRKLCIDFSSLNFHYADDAPSEVWTITAISATELSVVGSVSGRMPNAFLNVPYNNGIISFTIETLNSFFTLIPGFDAFVFYVLNPGPHIIFNNKDYYDAINQNWTVAATTTPGEFIVTNSTGAVQPERVYVNAPYKTKYLSFTLYDGEFAFRPGDIFTFSTYANAPTYLVYGSVSGMQRAINPGDTFNNGNLKFTLKAPIYVGSDSECVSSPSHAILSATSYLMAKRHNFSAPNPENNPTVLPNSGKLYFVNASNVFTKPRRDTWEEGYMLTAITPTSFEVVSSRRGKLKRAVVNQTYVDDYITFTIKSGTNPFIPRNPSDSTQQYDQFEFMTKPHPYGLWYSESAIISGRTIRSGSNVLISSVLNTASTYFAIKQVKYDTLKIEVGTETETEVLPHYVVGDIYYPAKEETVGVYLLDMPNYKIGEIKDNVLTATPNFIADYLSRDNVIDLQVTQQGTHQNRAVTRITENIVFRDKLSFKESMLVSMVASESFRFREAKLFYYDDISPRISESNKIKIKQCDLEPIFYTAGYDIFNFDNETELSGVSPSVPKINSYDNTDTLKLKSMACSIAIPDIAVIANTGVAENFVVYSKVPAGSSVHGPNGRAYVGFGPIKPLTLTDAFYYHDVINPAPRIPSTTMTYVIVNATTISNWGTVPIKRVILNDVGYNDPNILMVAPNVFLLGTMPTVANPSPPILEVLTASPIGDYTIAPYKGFYVDILSNFTSFVLTITI